MSWLTNWNYRKQLTVSNSGSTLTDYQVLFTVDTAALYTAGKLLSNCNDIRFTLSDGSTLLNYWIESGPNTVSTKIWVKIPSILNGSNTIYMYYGNPGATGVSEDPATQTNTAINGATKTVAQVALEIMGLSPTYAASIFNSSNLTVANAASILNNTNLAAARSALIFSDINIGASRVNSIIAHANLTSNREQTILGYMVTNGYIAKLIDIITANGPNTTYNTSSAITNTNIYRNLVVNSGVTLTVNTSASMTSSAIVAYDITNNGTITRTAQGAIGGAYGEISYDATVPANIYRIGSDTIGTGGSMVCLHYGAGGGANGVGSTYGGDGGPVTYTTKTSDELATLSLNAVIDYFIRTIQSKSSPTFPQEFINIYGTGAGSGYRGYSGTGGGGLIVVSKTLDNNLLINADGTNGNNAPGNQNAGGSGGGSGGEIIVVTNDYNNVGGTIRAKGGTGGNGTGEAGSAGGGGGGGIVYILYKTQNSAGALDITGNTSGTGGCGTPGNAGGSGTARSASILVSPGPLYEPTFSTVGAEEMPPANIGALSMTISPPSETPCRAGVCTVDVSVTWKNTGGSTGSSNLSITVSNGSPTITPSVYSSVSFTANQEITKTFTVSNMIAGTHSICPNPN
jgi:Domain of unknown function (DUF2341)